MRRVMSVCFDHRLLMLMFIAQTPRLGMFGSQCQICRWYAAQGNMRTSLDGNAKHAMRSVPEDAVGHVQFIHPVMLGFCLKIAEERLGWSDFLWYNVSPRSRYTLIHKPLDT